MSERNVEINVKTSSGYDQLHPAGVIANTTPDIDVTGTIPQTRWEEIPDRDGWYSAALSVSYMNNYCFPIITIYAEEMSTYYATNQDGVCELQVYGKPTSNINYHATFLPTSEMPVVPTPCHVSVVASKYVKQDVWELNSTDLSNFKTTRSFNPNDTSHLDFLLQADYIEIETGGSGSTERYGLSKITSYPNEAQFSNVSVGLNSWDGRNLVIRHGATKYTCIANHVHTEFTSPIEKHEEPIILTGSTSAKITAYKLPK